jgi:hypothetical protein
MINVAKKKSDGVMSNDVWWHTVVYLNYQATQCRSQNRLFLLILLRKNWDIYISSENKHRVQVMSSGGSS